MMTFPPDNYVLTESAVSGIEVYMPRPPKEMQQEVVEFHCPQCDATTAYSAENGGLTCTHCGHYEAPVQEVVGKAAVEFEFTVETIERAAHGWGIERKELSCNRCASHITLSTDMLTHTCPFCGSNQVVQVKAAQDVLRPRFLVPFKMTEDDCRRITANWLQNSWMLPKDLQQLARTAEFTPIYIPFWTFDAHASAYWRAEVAHTKQKTVWSGGRRTTKTVTEWRWESGNVEQFHDDLLVNGSNQISKVLLRQMRGYDLQELVPYDASYLAGMQAQAYDIGLEEAWELGRDAMRQRTKAACRTQATSQRMRNFSMSLDFSKETWRYILLPLYLATYAYGNERFQVMINGQSGKIAGQRPVDWRKVIGVTAVSMLPAILLGLLSLYLSNNVATADVGVPVGFVAVLALIGALVFIIRAVQTALQMDDA
ncbi:MAG: hypothetical protein KC413_04810 [Anaerolineales bacterium]|nr:hypothetical protein [Anaerolineales bacterium]